MHINTCVVKTAVVLGNSRVAVVYECAQSLDMGEGEGEGDGSGKTETAIGFVAWLSQRWRDAEDDRPRDSAGTRAS
jgi:hypothetical protein